MTNIKTLNPLITHFYDPVTGIRVKKGEKTVSEFWFRFLQAINSKAKLELSLEHPKLRFVNVHKVMYKKVVSDRIYQITKTQAIFYAFYQDETIGEVSYDSENKNFTEISRSEIAKAFYSNMKLHDNRFLIFVVFLSVSLIMLSSPVSSIKIFSLFLLGSGIYYYNYHQTLEIKARLEHYTHNLTT
jgi:hypothetical protein